MKAEPHRPAPGEVGRGLRRRPGVLPASLLAVGALLGILLTRRGPTTGTLPQEGRYADRNVVEAPLAPPPESGREQLESLSGTVSRANEEQGELLFLDAETGSIPVGACWTLRSSEDDEELGPFAVPENGTLRIPTGDWEAVSTDGDWSVATPRGLLPVRLGERLVVTVGRRGDLVVEVRAPGGAPVTGADVCWESLSDIGAWPYRPDGMPHELLPTELEEGAARGRTDATGRVALEISGGYGVVHVLAPGYAGFQREIQGPSEHPLRVDLTPTEQASNAVLHVLDDRDGLPVRGAVVSNGLGETRVSDGNGTVHLPLAFLDRRLVCRAPGFVPLDAWVPRGEHEHELRLPHTVRLELHVLADDAQPAARAFARFELNGDEIPFTWPRFATLDGTGRATLTFPAGVEGIVRVAGRDGSSGKARFALRGEQERVTVRMRLDDPLELEIVDETGRAIREGHVSVNYGGARGYLPDAETSLAIRSDGRVRVAYPDDVTRLLVWAPGHAPAGLVPRALHEYGQERCTAPLSGVLRVALHAAVPLRVRVQDDTGRPYPGVRVLAGAGRDEFVANTTAHRSLLGATPTSHPGWVRLVRLTREAITDGNGEVFFSDLEAGGYALSASLPLERNRGNVVADLVPEEQRDVVVPRTGPAVLTFPRVRRVTLHAVDGADGRPISVLQLLNDLYSEPIEAPGGFWDGWVPSQTDRLTLTAKGYALTEVSLPSGSEDVYRDVELWKDQGVPLELVGDIEGLAGRTLHYDIWAPGGPSGLRFHRGDEDLAVRSADDLEVSLDAPCEVSIRELESDGSRWSFTPQFQPWSPGEVLRFEVVRSSTPTGRH